MSRRHPNPARIIRQENPPPSGNVAGSGGRNPGSRWDDVAAYLRDEPRMWFVIPGW